MTRDEAVSLVKNLLFEDAATTALATDAQLNTVVEEANKKVFAKIAKKTQSFFESRKDFTAANAGYFDLSEVDAAGVYRVSRVLLKYQGDYLPIEALSGNDATAYAFPQQNVGSPYGYYFEGDRVYLAPGPSTVQSFRVIYVPRLAALSGSTALLAGKLPEFHSLVAYEAAMFLAAKDEARLEPIGLLRNELQKELSEYVERRQVQRPSVIREVPFA